MRYLGAIAGLMALLSGLLAGCSASPAAAPDREQGAPAGADRLPVVATFSIVGDVVRQVGGGRVAVTELVGSGGDAHTFEPTPEDGRALAQAKLVYEVGLGFETWLDDLFTASGSAATRVALGEKLATRTMAEGEQHAESEEHAEGDEHGHGDIDPHVWHDVANVIAITEQVRDSLAAADPAGAATYQANAAAYIAQLQELDSYIKAQVESIPAERRKLVTTHDTFGYFAARYGFEVVGTGLGSLSTEVADPSPAALAKLIGAIRATGVPAIFAENVSNPRLMEQIASEAGVRLGPPLYTDALGEPGTPGATYIGMMRANIDALVAALR